MEVVEGTEETGGYLGRFGSRPLPGRPSEPPGPEDPGPVVAEGDTAGASGAGVTPADGSACAPPDA
ncbi:hypothetical protein SMCF_4463, partial [Streptomyces coelicoflavus ZG0656]